MISRKDLNLLQGGLDDDKRELSAIDLLEIDHERQLGICDVLSNSTDSLIEDCNIALLTSILCFLQDELPRHTLDEENGLFPLLRERSKNDNSALAIIEQLQTEHKFDAEIVEYICVDLAVLAKGGNLVNPQRLAINMRAFAEAHRRHIEWENVALLPMARLKLMPEDLRALQKKFVETRWTKSTQK